MSLQSKKSMGGTIVLVMLGLVAFYTGTRWLSFLVPAGLLIWGMAQMTLRSNRN